MKLKRFIAILLVLMLSWTISYADKPHNEAADKLVNHISDDFFERNYWHIDEFVRAKQAQI